MSHRHLDHVTLGILSNKGRLGRLVDEIRDFTRFVPEIGYRLDDGHAESSWLRGVAEVERMTSG